VEWAFDRYYACTGDNAFNGTTPSTEQRLQRNNAFNGDFNGLQQNRDNGAEQCRDPTSPQRSRVHVAVGILEHSPERTGIWDRVGVVMGMGKGCSK
jgi:hypothetical protein